MPHPQTILVVDDDADIRSIVRLLFTMHGYHVVEAADGITALRCARQIAPDLIVLDLGLPGQDGWAVAQELRSDPAFEDTPILVITAYGDQAAFRAAWAAGCQAMVKKPFAIESLAETARTLLTRATAGLGSAWHPVGAQFVRSP